MKQLSAEDTTRLLAALHQGDDRATVRLLVELAGISRAGTYDVEVDPGTSTSVIRPVRLTDSPSA